MINLFIAKIQVNNYVMCFRGAIVAKRLNQEKKKPQSKVHFVLPDFPLLQYTQRLYGISELRCRLSRLPLVFLLLR